MRNRLLILFFAFALAINVGQMFLGWASIPAYYQRVTTHTIEPYVAGAVVINNETVATEAAERGLSLPAYALYESLLNSVLALVPLIVAAVAAWRARGQWFAWYTAFIIVFLGGFGLADQARVAQLVPHEWYEIGAIFWFLLLPYFYLFPNGKPVPRRLLWLVGALMLYHFIIQVASVLWTIFPEIAASLPSWDWQAVLVIGVVPILLNFVVTFACQVYRYLRISTATERQQTKWFLFGFGIMIATLPVPLITGENAGFVDDLIGANSVLFFLLLPVTIAIAILRYRLWEIDIIIRRTLVYVPLTGIVAGLYSAAVALFQRLFQALTGESSDAAIVIATLILASLFTPLKNTLQSFVDKRFKEAPHHTKELQVFGEHARLVGHLVELDARQVSRGFLEEAISAFHAQGGAVYLGKDGGLELVHTSGTWNSKEGGEGEAGNEDKDAGMSVYLESDGEKLGLLSLGIHEDGGGYTKHDHEVLQQVADQVAQVIREEKVVVDKTNVNRS